MPGLRKDTTQAIIEGLLKFIAAGGFVTTALVIPNSPIIFGKPLEKLFDKLDKRSQEREIRRVIQYMRQRGLIKYTPRDYENGILLTSSGKKRLEESSSNKIIIKKPQKWDEKWRLVFFDVPEVYKSKRLALTHRLRLLGFQPLQLSIWIHPFECRGEIEATAELCGIRSYLTYVEVESIDGSDKLINRFKNLIH